MIFTTFFSYSTNKTKSPCANSRYSQCLDCFSYLLPAVLCMWPTFVCDQPEDISRFHHVCCPVFPKKKLCSWQLLCLQSIYFHESFAWCWNDKYPKGGGLNVVFLTVCIQRWWCFRFLPVVGYWHMNFFLSVQDISFQVPSVIKTRQFFVSVLVGCPFLQFL